MVGKINKKSNLFRKICAAQSVKFNKDRTISTRKYYCHRSGVFISKSVEKRVLKITGPCKIGLYTNLYSQNTYFKHHCIVEPCN